VCVHHHERNEAFKANMIALKYKPVAVEMMDNRILELTEDSLSQRHNRFFLEGKPGSIMIVEFACDTVDDLELRVNKLIGDLKKHGLGYAYPVIRGKDITRVWNLRKAGLGVLANMKGDPKPVSLIEDTAVRVEQLDDYISDIGQMLESFGRDAVYHAHIGTGELHLRPVLNLKDPEDVILFRRIGIETARIVKKYRGSMSGEHGDGRLRGEFIPIILGEKNYKLLEEIKLCWDPVNILNPGKITATPPMNTCLRYEPGKETREIKTIFDFSSTAGIIRAAEKCNGSADCRKSVSIGGTMCPSYMATGEEENTTRARANVIREFMSDENTDPWDHPEILGILDLCLSCKGCKSECPSGVDMAKLKSEFLQHWHDKHGASLRTRMFAHISTLNSIGSLLPPVYNFFLKNDFFSGLIKRISGIAVERNIPLLYKTTLRRWAGKNLPLINPSDPKRTIALFVDEFTNYNDTESGIAAIKLLTSLGYRVIIPDHCQSGRSFISKGFLRDAARRARKNIKLLSGIISAEIPLVGIEPSAILSFRDEYPDLAGEELREASLKLASNTFLFEEFIVDEFRAGRIVKEDFTTDSAVIAVHGHCQQKAVVSSAPTLEMLSIPANYSVREIPSGCCGMAGSFGYEKEHYGLSMKIGEMVLFPEIRDAGEDALIAAPGTSCRSQIFDGTGRIARHPADILNAALKIKAKNSKPL
ncbi:MAG: FAD-linked oxidase C-terminal domain-containing protein, partial [Bacteroidales bacterium]|nr:FAD-linked oxidase C-terminal domain-containing protein [Bacteroidales bacterium]